jgi:crotonobetainyl-CoA:carnitine CoA-transferase CaiB-like acyl-CoA transferase
VISMSGSPLTDLLVLDLTRLLPGPLCTMILGDYGADVIKIEDPDHGDPTRYIGSQIEGSGTFFRQINRNKRSFAVNLKSEQGRNILYRLVKKADVLVEGFRPGVMQRLGLDYDSLASVNPRLIYASISGYGQQGSFSAKAGHDLNYTALTGLLDLSADEDGEPVMPAVQIADIGAGSLMAVVGILMALHDRDTRGKGSFVDISMTRGLLPWLTYASSALFERKEIPGRNRGQITGAYACYNLYQTADGKYISLGALEPIFWERFCHTVERPEWIERQYDALQQKELFTQVQQLIKNKTRQQWIEIFSEIDACCEPVLSLEEAIKHPLSIENNFWFENKLANNATELLTGFPLLFSGNPGTLRLQPPRHGEHSSQILHELNYSEQEIQILFDSGIISSNT